MKLVRRQNRDGSTSWKLYWELGRDPVTGKRLQRVETIRGTKKDAERRWRDVQREIEGGYNGRQARMRVGELLDRWLTDVVEVRGKRTTLQAYRQLVRTYIIPYLGHVRLEDLTPADLQRLYRTLMDRGLSPATIRNVHARLHSALQQAVRWGLVMRNVATMAQAPSIGQSDIRVWTPEQCARFLAVAKHHRWYVAFLLALLGGLRKGEVLGARWVDLDPPYLRIVQTVSNWKTFETPKTRSSRRTITLDPITLQALEEHRLRQEADKRLCGADYRDHGLIVQTRIGTPVPPRNLVRALHALEREAGVPHLSFHGLRHTHASLLLRQGEHLRLVAERLGHSNPGFTVSVYAHLLPDAQGQAAERLARSIFGDQTGTTPTDSRLDGP